MVLGREVRSEAHSERCAGKKADWGLQPPPEPSKLGCRLHKQCSMHAVLLGKEHANDQVPVQFV